MNKLRQEYCKESGLNYFKPENTEINDYVVWLEKRIETLSTFDVVGQSEQLHECSHRKGEECIKPSSCSAFGCNKPM